MSFDPTIDPLTQEAWDHIISDARDGYQSNLDAGYDDAHNRRVGELIEALERLRYNYMAMTMITVERQNL